MVLTRPLRAGVAAAFIASALAAAGAGLAHDAHDPRHRAMESMGEHMKALRRVVEGTAQLGAEATSHARAVQDGAEALLSLFRESSRGRKGSREKPEIWRDWAGFSAAAAGFEEAADNLVAAAADGDKALLGTALKRAGGKCAACHDRYREPKK